MFRAIFVLPLTINLVAGNLKRPEERVVAGPCKCHPNWAECEDHWGEMGLTGCKNTGQSCAEWCPGDGEWKVLYREMVATVTKHVATCSEDPTARWGQRKAGPSGPFAISFTGGLRNFVGTWFSWQANIVEPSGGDVHLYFHVTP